MALAMLLAPDEITAVSRPANSPSTCRTLGFWQGTWHSRHTIGVVGHS